jgi:hypothetical protein
MDLSILSLKAIQTPIRLQGHQQIYKLINPSITPRPLVDLPRLINLSADLQICQTDYTKAKLIQIDILQF